MTEPIELKEVIVSGSVLGASEIKRLIEQENMISEFGLGTDKQLQPEGFDLTVREIRNFIDAGRVLIDRTEVSAIRPNIDDFWGGGWHLKPGSYQILFNEVLKLPKNIHAFTVQRSSIPRCACISHVGSFDAGYNGRGVMTIFVGEQGIFIEKNAGFAQAHFFYVLGKNYRYRGHYQSENLNGGKENELYRKV